MSERGTYWVAERTSAIPSPTGPIPVQEGDIVIVHVVKSWSEAARVIAERDRGDRR